MIEELFKTTKSMGTVPLPVGTSVCTTGPGARSRCSLRHRVEPGVVRSKSPFHLLLVPGYMSWEPLYLCCHVAAALPHPIGRDARVDEECHKDRMHNNSLIVVGSKLRTQHVFESKD